MLAFLYKKQHCSNASTYSLTRKRITVYMLDSEHQVELVVIMLQSLL